MRQIDDVPGGSDIGPVTVGLRDELRWALLCAEQAYQQDRCERTERELMAARDAVIREDREGWWPPELEDCEWRFEQRVDWVRPKGSGDDAWQKAPVDPLEQEPMPTPEMIKWEEHSMYLCPWPSQLDPNPDMTKPINELTRLEKLARFRRECDDFFERWEKAEAEVPRDRVKCERLRRAMARAGRAYNRVENDWFPPEYADCVDGYDMNMGYGPNGGKIRPYRSKGPWRPYPKDPFSDLYE